MDRRDFLKILLATPVAATYDFEQLLWVPKPMVIVPAKSIPSHILLDDWGRRFVYIDHRGVSHYANSFQDVERFLSANYERWLKESEAI